MANQNPQPEIYTTKHEFASSVAAGGIDTQTVFTQQNSSEEVRIYSISVNMYETGTGVSAGGADRDWTAKIKIGNSYVPSHEFDLGVIQNSTSKMLTFPTPLLVLFQQPISVTVQWKGGSDGVTVGQDMTVKVSLHAELSTAQVACAPDGSMSYPGGNRRGA